MRLQPFFVDADGRRLNVGQPGALDFFRGATAQALKEENWELAEALSRETLRGCVALGEPAEATLTAHANVGAVLQRAGKLEAAVDVAQRVALKRSEVLGQAHPTTLRSVLALAIYLREARGEQDEEAALLSADVTRAAHEVLPAVLRATRDAGTLHGAFDLASLFVELGQPQDAVPLLREVLQAWRESLGSSPRHPEVCTQTCRAAQPG